MCVSGKGPVRGGFPISNYVVCIQSCDGSRSGYIIQFSHFVFCITGNQLMSLIYTLKVRLSCESLLLVTIPSVCLTRLLWDTTLHLHITDQCSCSHTHLKRGLVRFQVSPQCESVARLVMDLIYHGNKTVT